MTSKLRHLLLLSVMLFAGSVWTGWSQNNLKSYNIKGTLMGADTKESLIGANVRLLNPKDSSLYKGAIADIDGVYTLEKVKPGKFRLIITSIGYETIDSLITVSGNKRTIAMGTTYMDPSATALQTLVVDHYGAPVVVKKDTTEFDASAFVVRQGATVEELIKKIPGMEVDDEGAIKYNGESIQGLQVDGRDFFTETPTMGTQNLPSEIVERLQVVDKKSDESLMTGMEDGNRKKIINLMLKEDKKQGLMGRVSAGYGTEDRYEADFMLNAFKGKSRYTLLGNSNNLPRGWRMRGLEQRHSIGLNIDHQFSQKLSVNGDIGFDEHRNTRRGYNISTELIGGDEAQKSHENFENISRRRGLYVSGRVEWKPDTLTRVIIRPNLNYGTGKTNNFQEFRTDRLSGERINSGEKRNLGDNNNIDASVHFNASRRLNQKGRNLYVGGRIGFSSGEDESTVHNNTMFYQLGGKNTILDQQVLQNNKNRSARLRTSWVEPLWKNIFLQLQYNPQFTYSESDRNAYNKDASGEYTQRDPQYSKGNSYSTVAHRFGFNLRYQKKTLNAQAGFMWVPTTSRSIYELGDGSKHDRSRSVWDYSPTLRVEYNKDRGSRLFLSYRGYTSQPSMNQLMPIEDLRDPLNKTIGNPNLLPSFDHSLRLGGSFSNAAKRSFLNMFARGSYMQRGVVPKTTVNRETGGRTTTYENVDGDYNLMMHLNYSKGIGKTPLTIDMGTFYFNSASKGYTNEELGMTNSNNPGASLTLRWNKEPISFSIGGNGRWSFVTNSISEQLNKNTRDLGLRADFNITLPWDMHLSTDYNWNRRSGYNEVMDGDYHLWNATLSKSFLKNNAATLELSWNDILNQRKTFSRRTTSRAITDSFVDGITTYGMLTFRYNFTAFGANGGDQPSFNGPRMRGPGRGYHRRR